ncbi:LOW QUALITY PROTEIN: zinc finger protein 62 homolog [Nilaparvata lugens]|uniref:LOW QUALITY PROTEIN: zinc finger protein 62 homolog n=1 Tax=Nilaparvata lugens TaxID=108931 RepID=UPI00193E120A|nr:LOW QUALITY PROTEIN: zinc finger protein 62 homolog [Nilaparvata lugens]
MRTSCVDDSWLVSYDTIEYSNAKPESFATYSLLCWGEWWYFDRGVCLNGITAYERGTVCDSMFIYLELHPKIKLVRPLQQQQQQQQPQNLNLRSVVFNNAAFQPDSVNPSGSQPSVDTIAPNNVENNNNSMRRILLGKIFCSVPDLSAHVRERHWPLTGSDYCCDICGRPYPNKSKMFRHRKLHALPESEGGLPAGHELEEIPPPNESRPVLEVFEQLTCSLCPDQEFQCLEDLSKHRKTAHNLVPCDLCPKFYGRSSHLWKHVNKIHKNHPDITCSVCFRTSASRNHLANHIAKHHRHEVLCQNYVDICELSNEEAVHNCVKCNKVFRKHLLLKKHMRHCTGPPNQPASGPSPCERCTKVFDSPIQLRKHLRNSHLHFRCELCEDVAHDSRIELMDHIKAAHAGDPSLTCDYKGCGMMLRCTADMAKHRREHRQGRPPPTCSFCGELTPNKMKLRNHLKQHPQLTKHLCSICLVTMKDFDELRKHVRSKHKSMLGKTNICPICVRTYSNKSKVLVHIRSHGEGFFPCEICVKVFTDPEKHKRHTDAHFDENSEELEAEEEEEEEEEDAANQEQEEEEVDGEDEEENVKEDEKEESSVKKKKVSEEDEEEEEDEVEEEDDEEEEEGEEEDEETKTEDVESVITKRTSDDEEADEKEDVSSSQIEIEDDEDTNETAPAKRQRRTHPCIACTRTFTNSTSFLRHMKAEHVELICACGKMSENIQSHNNHLKKCITGKKKESDKVEEKRPPNKKSLEKKFLNSDSKGMTNTPVTPTEVNKAVDKPVTPVVNTSAKREVRRVYKSDDGLCSCELCKKQFEAKRHLWQHLRRFHLKEASSSCGVCLKVCKDYDALDTHLALEHKTNFEGEGKNFTCRVCGRYHNSRLKLEQHSVIHPGHEMRTHASLHSCSLCPIQFNSAISLAVHQSNDHKGKSVRGGAVKMDVDGPENDEDSRSSTSSSSSANSSCSTSSGSSSSSSGSSSSSSSSSSSTSSGSNSSSSSNSSEEKGSKSSKDSKVSKLSPLLKQAQRRPEKSAWSSIHKEAVSRSSERNRNNPKPDLNKSLIDNCVQSEDDNDVIVLSDENNANSAGAFNNSEATFVEDNVNLSEDSSASSNEDVVEDDEDEAVSSVAGLEKDMSATAEV